MLCKKQLFCCLRQNFMKSAAASYQRIRLIFVSVVFKTGEFGFRPGTKRKINWSSVDCNEVCVSETSCGKYVNWVNTRLNRYTSDTVFVVHLGISCKNVYILVFLYVQVWQCGNCLFSKIISLKIVPRLNFAQATIVIFLQVETSFMPGNFDVRCAWVQLLTH